MSKTNKIKIKILKKFASPLTGRRTEIGEELNVPANQFWFKRIAEKDCEKIKKFSKAQASEKKSSGKVDAKEKNNSKGSK